MSLKERAANLWARLSKQYRLVVYDHESLSQSRHVFFKPVTAIALGAGALVLVIALTALLFSVLPGIGGGLSGGSGILSDDYKDMQAKNRDLEKQVNALDSMLGVMTNVLGADNNRQPEKPMWASAMPEPAQVPDHQEEVPQDGGNPAPAANPPSPSPKPNPVSEASAPVRHTPAVYHLMPPIDGYVTKDFIPKDKPHFGIDLAANENALVRAVADGVVIFAEYSSTTGHVVGIWHSQYSMVSFYKHNSRTYKTVGSTVFAGEAIAVIGNTGINSSGTHLHFELWHNGNPVDPAAYIHFN